MLPRYAAKIQVSKYIFYIQRNLRDFHLSKCCAILIPLSDNLFSDFFFFFKSCPRIDWPVTNNAVNRQLPPAHPFHHLPRLQGLVILVQPISGNWMMGGYKCLGISAQHGTLWWAPFTWGFVRPASQFNFFLCPILFPPSFHRYRTLNSILQSKLLLSTCFWRNQPLTEK